MVAQVWSKMRFSGGKGLLIQAMIFVAWSLVLSNAWAARDYRPHGGYISSTVAERSIVERDLEIIQPPDSDGRPLQEVIFNEKLTKEFRERYDDKFGRTDAERIYNSPNRTTYYNDVWYRGSPEEMNNERRAFGEFMMKRLAEYHLDEYMKNDPKGKQIYAIKERVSNVGVQVKKFKFDLRYEIAGNTLDLIVRNPYMDTAKVRFQMGGTLLGSVNQTIVTLGKVITPTITVETYIQDPDRKVSFITRKMLTPSLSANVTATSGQRNLGITPGNLETWITESIYLAGANYTF